jgi:hypothetical protein
VSAILSDIKGQNRRAMVRDFVAGAAADLLGEIDAELVADKLDEPTRESLGRIHPSWMGGEYLPDYLPGEVEIARIVLASVTQDVISVRTRRRPGGRRILYRIVDEYHEPDRPEWGCRPASSARPLTLAQLIALIERAGEPDLGECESLTDRIRDYQSADDPESVADFVRVESVFYPTLSGWFEERAAKWLERRRREREEDLGDDDA